MAKSARNRIERILARITGRPPSLMGRRRRHTTLVPNDLSSAVPPLESGEGDRRRRWRGALAAAYPILAYSPDHRREIIRPEPRRLGLAEKLRCSREERQVHPGRLGK